MRKRKTNQCEKILAYIREYGGITQHDAVRLGCYRLSARIWDLRKAGNKIITMPLSVRNMDGSTSTVAYYRFKKETE